MSSFEPPPVRARPVAPEPSPVTGAVGLNLPQVTRREAWLDLLVVLVVGVIGPFLPSLAVGLGLADGALLPAGEVGPLELAAKTGEALVAIVLLTYFVARHRLPLAGFGVHGRHLWLQLLAVPAIVIASYLAIALLALPMILSTAGATDLPEHLKDDLGQKIEFARRMPQNVAMIVPLLVPVVLHEEILFRALLLPYLRRVVGNWPVAIVIGGLIFGSLHFTQGTLAMVQIAGVGIVFGTAFVLTRSLLAVVLAHFAFNFAQMMLFRMMEDTAIFDVIEMLG